MTLFSTQLPVLVLTGLAFTLALALIEPIARQSIEELGLLSRQTAGELTALEQQKVERIYFDAGLLGFAAGAFVLGCLHSTGLFPHDATLPIALVLMLVAIVFKASHRAVLTRKALCACG